MTLPHCTRAAHRSCCARTEDRRLADLWAWAPTACTVLVVLVLCSAARAADWPQWRGPARNGLSSETGLNWAWGPAGPRRLWTAQVGQGFSSVAVSGGRLYTMGNDGSRDSVFCLDALTGRQIWRFSYACGPGDYEGPRATPTVAGGRVYTLSREGEAHCLKAANGQLVWRRDLRGEMRAEPPRWGFAGSPLLAGSLVLYNVGTAGIAVNAGTGKTVWASGPRQAGYASPVPFTAGGKRGVALFVAWGIVAVNPEDGRPLWQHPWETSFGVNAADPIFSGDQVFISSDYGRGGAVLRISGPRPQRVWENREMKNHFNSCVLIGGSLYGNDENTLKCVDFRTGAERWRLRGIGKGGLIAADGRLVVLSERGELIVASATPERYQELARARIMRGECWTHPVIANGVLYCRTRQGELAAFDLRPAR